MGETDSTLEEESTVTKNKSFAKQDSSSLALAKQNSCTHSERESKRQGNSATTAAGCQVTQDSITGDVVSVARDCARKRPRKRVSILHDFVGDSFWRNHPEIID